MRIARKGRLTTSLSVQLQVQEYRSSVNRPAHKATSAIVDALASLIMHQSNSRTIEGFDKHIKYAYIIGLEYTSTER